MDSMFPKSVIHRCEGGGIGMDFFEDENCEMQIYGTGYGFDGCNMKVIDDKP